MVFFCNETGVRIAGPGVSKAVDPVNGLDECAPPPVESEVAQCSNCVVLSKSLNEVDSVYAGAQAEIAALTKQLDELTKPAPKQDPKPADAGKPEPKGEPAKTK